MVLRNGRIHLRIKGSKTDPFVEGVTLFIAPTHSSICPVRALKRYLSRVRRASPFCLRSDRYLTRNIASRAALRRNGTDVANNLLTHFVLGQPQLRLQLVFLIH